MTYDDSCEYTNAYTTNKNMYLFCVDVIATFTRMAAILKKKNSARHIIFILVGFSDPENKEIDTNIKFLSPLFAEIWDIENSHRPF